MYTTVHVQFSKDIDLNHFKIIDITSTGDEMEINDQLEVHMGTAEGVRGAWLRDLHAQVILRFSAAGGRAGEEAQLVVEFDRATGTKRHVIDMQFDDRGYCSTGSMVLPTS